MHSLAQDAKAPTVLRKWQQQLQPASDSVWHQVAKMRTRTRPSAAKTRQAKLPYGYVSGSTTLGFEVRQGSAWRPQQSMQPDRVIAAIMAVNLAVFELWQLFPRSDFLNHHFICSSDHLRKGYVHTLLTSSFSHQWLSHLFSSMLFFYSFGTSLAHAIGTVRVRFCPAGSCDLM